MPHAPRRPMTANKSRRGRNRPDAIQEDAAETLCVGQLAENLGFTSLVPAGSDRVDFKDVYCLALDNALRMAYRAGAASRLPRGALTRETANLDAALYVASCFAGQAPQVIFVTTDPALADPHTGERYRIVEETSGSFVALHGDPRWSRAYRLGK